MIRCSLFLIFVISMNTAVFAEGYHPSVQIDENLSTTKTWDGASIQYPSGTARVTGAIITLPPGTETGWHMHPVPCLALILEG
jgi:quercetin dioxygenase-like cupin family protein